MIDDLDLPLQEELDYLDDIGLDLEKNYQIWHHRRCIVEKAKDTSREKAFLEDILDSDAKNYQAWSYRLWLVQRFSMWEGEQDFVEKMLDADVGNNSVWSYRYFLLAHAQGGLTLENVKNEIDYIMKKRLPWNLQNECAWEYIRGMVGAKEELDKRIVKYCCLDFPELKSFCEKLIEEDFNKGNRFIQYILLDFDIAENNLDKAKERLTMLMTTDRIRENFYKWKLQKLIS